MPKQGESQLLQEKDIHFNYSRSERMADTDSSCVDAAVQFSADIGHPSPIRRTALIMLGQGLFLKAEADVHSVTVHDRADLPNSLAILDDASLETIHLVMKAHTVSTLFDETSVSLLAEKLSPGADMTVHVLLNEIGQQTVPEDDMETIRTSFVLSSLRIVSEAEGRDGSRQMTGRKAGGKEEGDNDDE